MKLCTAAALSAVAAALTLAASAHADSANDRAFVNDIRATGWVTSQVTDEQIISVGHQTCDQLGSAPTAEVVNQFTQKGIPRAQAEKAVSLAIKDLCPQSGR